MSEHNKSSSSDESWPKLALPYNEFDALISDINNEELVEIGLTKGIGHLSSGTFSSPAFPVTGTIHGLNIRYMVPLICQRAGKPNSKAVFIWFLVDTGSPFTCLSVKSLESLFGEGNVTHSRFDVAIQDEKSRIECEVSKAHFQEVNILGANAMRRLKLSIVVDWEEETFKLTKS
ncbi:Protein CBG15215 [Caenorhabditis briggsae]|nr:Protein CBG15215 [Caenorhabditis briggsae]ULT98445.1 hypothetical protein L3Y34_000072 [Caenorhabditis briggsae]CAP33537.2 Protein CBG15215 [Caenorhabditis briggsae]